MPAKYEAIRDKFLSEGKPEKEAKSAAAAIYNSQLKPGQAPVTGHDKRHRHRKPKGLAASRKPMH